MHIKDVEFSEIRFENDACSGIVILLTDAGATHCTCHAGVESGYDVPTMQQALLSDALRQIGRMPEYRRGQRQITLSQHLTAAPLPLAA